MGIQGLVELQAQPLAPVGLLDCRVVDLEFLGATLLAIVGLNGPLDLAESFATDPGQPGLQEVTLVLPDRQPGPLGPVVLWE